MAIVTVIDQITEWVGEKICPLVEFKVPSDIVQDGQYDYDLVHPAAFSMYLPTVDKLPAGVDSPVPSVTVRIQGTTDTPTRGERQLDVSLLFATWDPGIHTQDLYRSTVESQYFSDPYARNTEVTYTKGMEGWRDAWNFLDTAIRTIENEEYIGKYRFIKEKGIKSGPITSQKGLADLYPYWYAFCEFSVMEEIGHERKHTLYENLL